MKRTVLIVTLLASLLAFSAGNALSTIIVNFNPGSTSATVGSTFNVDITADVLRTESLVGWGFDLLFNATQLTLNSATSSPYWDLMFGSNNLTALLLPGPTSPDPGLSGSGLLLATLNFTCLGPGISGLGISVNSQDPIQGFMTFDGQYAEWKAMPGSIEQGTNPVVPEPSTVFLLSSGLAGLAWFSHKKKKT